MARRSAEWPPFANVMTSATPTTPVAPAPQDDARIEVESPQKEVVRLYIPREYYLIPLSTTSLGLALGFLRGARTSSLRFLAENAHRPPRTLEEWYFYHKSKNYRVLMGGVKASGREGMRMGAAGLVWVGFEEGCRRVGGGVGEWREVGAGVGLAGVVSLFCVWFSLSFYDECCIYDDDLQYDRPTASEDCGASRITGCDGG